MNDECISTSRYEPHLRLLFSILWNILLIFFSYAVRLKFIPSYVIYIDMDAAAITAIGWRHHSSPHNRLLLLYNYYL